MKNRSSQAQTMISPQQIKLIHTLKSAIGMDDDLYRCALYENFRVESSKDLTFVQAERVLGIFKKEAIAQGVWKEKAKSDQYRELKRRPGYATPAQLSYIDGLWKDVSRASDENRQNALRSFLMRQAGVSDLRFLTSEKAAAVLSALKHMKSRQQEVRG